MSVRERYQGPLKPAVQYPTFARQRKQIGTQVQDINEEITVNEKLVLSLRKHAKHMLQIINVSSAQLFPSIFAEAYSSLSRYSQILTEINCKLEVLMTKEVRQWNTMSTKYNSPSIKPFIWDSNERKANQTDVAKSVRSVNSKPIPKPPAVTSLKKKNNNANSSSSNSVKDQKKSKPKSQSSGVNVKPKKKTKSASDKSNTKTEKAKTDKAKTDKGKTDKAKTDKAKTDKAKTDKAKTDKAKTDKAKTDKAKTDKAKNKKKASNVVKNKTQPESVQAKTVEAKDKNAAGSAAKKKKKKSKNSCLALTKNNNSTNNCNKSDLVVSGQEKEQNVEKVRHVIENIKLSFNTKYKGYVTLLISPIEFYTHFVIEEDRLEKFDEFIKELELYCKNYQFPSSKQKGKTISSRKQLVSQKLNGYALLYLQSAFHRVKIKNWNLTKNDDSVTVDLLDVGGTKDVSLYNLHPIPDELMRYPAFASRCHLAGVPEDVSRITGTVDFFRSWVNKAKTVTVEISEEKSGVSSESLPVIMYDDSTKCPINELIVSMIQDNQKKPKESLEKWDPMSEAFNSNMNLYDFDADDPAAPIYGYVGKDYERVCKLYGNTGKCYKIACRKEHVVLDSKGFTTDKEEIYVRALNPLKIPKVKALSVRVTHVESPSSFYCILDVRESDAAEESLLSLHSYMNQSQNISEMKKMLTPPAVGQVVAAQFPKDKSWYRARVISVLPENDECTVFYVDHGSVANVNFSCIRAMEPRYLHLPFQAIFCEICGIGEQQKTSNLAVTYLTENLDDVSTVEVVSTLPGEQPHLLVNLYTSKGENIAKQLLLLKLVACKENIHLDESKIYLPG